MSKALKKVSGEDAFIRDIELRPSEIVSRVNETREALGRRRDALAGRPSKPLMQESIATHPFLVTIDGRAICQTTAQVEALMARRRDLVIAHLPSVRLHFPRTLLRADAAETSLQLRPSLFNILVTSMRNPKMPVGHQNISPLSRKSLTAQSLRTLVWEITIRLTDFGLAGRILSKERVARSQSTTGWGFALCPYWRYAIVEMHDVDSSDDSLNRSVDSPEGQITQ